MTSDFQEQLDELDSLRQHCRQATVEFTDRWQPEVDRYRHEIALGVADALEQFSRRMDEMARGNTWCRDLAKDAVDYVEWLQWTFWDLPYFAVIHQPDAEKFRRNVASCGFVYLSLRFVDDLIDRHYRYRDRKPTLLASMVRRLGGGYRAESMTFLAALMLCLEGLDRLANEDLEGEAGGRLREVLRATRHTLVGAAMELAPSGVADLAEYDHLSHLKNVEYWRILHAAIDPESRSPLTPFLADYYHLAQKLNDVQDQAADEARDQPNLVTLCRSWLAAEARAQPLTQPLTQQSAQQEVAAILAGEFLALAGRLDSLPALEQAVAAVKLGEYLEEAYRLGLFVEPSQSATEESPYPRTAGLHWTSNAEEFLDSLGAEALAETDCPICRSTESRQLFRKQGFAFRRCLACRHIYVGPRLDEALQALLDEELAEDLEDSFLDVGRIFADFVCRKLHQHTVGDRLLDVGFGAGHLLQLARVHGFEAYGVDGSPQAVERLRPLLGNRVCQLRVDGEQPLPWGKFDAVVLSHVLEHMAEPRRLLAQVQQTLMPRGLLYIAVPDLESMQFRILGKRWDVIQPVVHYQYFCRDSLQRLLLDSGFEVVEWIEHPEFRAARATGWQRMLRRLGGSESGELAVLARLPAAGSHLEEPAEEQE